MKFERLAVAVVSWGLASGVAGCGVAEPPPACVGYVAAPLHNASADPGSVELDDAQRSAIGTVETNAGSVLCTASYLGGAFALTAAHCARAGELLVRFGTADPMPVRKLSRHPDLDVMVVEFDAPSAPLEEVSPIELWRGAVDASWQQRTVTLAGRGLTEHGTSGALRFAEEPVTSVSATDLVVDGKGKTGACGGDSGGPLLVGDASKRAHVAGVLERGSSDCLGADVYLRADAFSTWLDGAIAPGADCTP